MLWVRVLFPPFRMTEEEAQRPGFTHLSHVKAGTGASVATTLGFRNFAAKSA